ncbi:MAG: STAS/SEC14 domain-containing protein [Alphaproteobacteria bacterium]|nr:STAS/SEC14 domain-containing protein [Alphaproteobacteria bacterium]
MIMIENNTGNLVEVTVQGALQEGDFKDLAQRADALIEKYGHVRIMVDVSRFEGWENFEAAERHFDFVRRHHENVERLAVIAGHAWQHWMAAMGGVFLHPEVKVFDPAQREDAKRWALAGGRIAAE